MSEINYWVCIVNNLRDDFDKKTEEILKFLELIDFLDKANADVISANIKFENTSEIRKTLKGTVYILLYNLIESTMREAICFIHDTIEEKGINFDDLKTELKREVLKRIKHESLKIETLLSKLTNGISKGLPLGTFDSKNLFSGNIDRKEINSKSKIYGFFTQTDYTQTKHGEDLSTVKEYRNSLAHGNCSFSEAGMNSSHEDLKNLSCQVIAYLDSILTNISTYVRNQSYLENHIS